MQQDVAAIFVRELKRVMKAGDPSAAALQKELSVITLFGNARTKAGMRCAVGRTGHVARVGLSGGVRTVAPQTPPCPAEVAMKLVMLDSYDLAFRIMQEYRLPTVDVFQNAVRALGRAKQIGKIGDVLKNIKVRTGHAPGNLRAAVPRCGCFCSCSTAA